MNIQMLNQVPARIHIKVCFSVIFLLLITRSMLVEAQAQDYQARLDQLHSQMEGLCRITDSLFNIHDDLYNGSLYTSTADRTDHPFFLENSWMPGTVYYSGTFSGSEIIKYDITTDNVIILLQERGASFPVSVNRSVINEFIISGHLFTFLNDFPDNGNHSLMPGYYEVLYNGPTAFFARWVKRKAANKATMQTEYPLEVSYYIKRKGEYHLIKNKALFIDLLSDHKDEIRSYMKTNKLRFSPGKSENAVKILEYYDNL